MSVSHDTKRQINISRALAKYDPEAAQRYREKIPLRQKLSFGGSNKEDIKDAREIWKNSLD
jgi:hypothetical protein